jgi:hypothetical protein
LASSPPASADGTQESAHTTARDRRVTWLVALAAFVIVALVYLPALQGGFLAFDDDQFVSNNPLIKGGLSLALVREVFTRAVALHYAPLMFLSHATDVTLFGLDPRGHHATSVLLHAVNAALVVVVFTRLTRSRSAGAIAAALFALHPLRVESVAWVAERKDVLSGLFFLLCLWAWCDRRLLLAWLALALGLLSKGTLVTVPALLFLLDVLVLGRAHGALKRAALFVVPAAAAALGILLTQAPSITHSDDWRAPVRIGNAVVSVLRYAGKELWPADLSPWYGLPPGGWPWLAVVGAALTLAAITAAAVLWWRRSGDGVPLAGWLWFCGVLMPMLGFVKAGIQAMADRYTYLAGLGLVLVVVHVGALVLARIGRDAPASRARIGAAVALVSVLLVWRTEAQIPVWHDDGALWRRAMASEPWNPWPPFFAADRALAAGDVDGAKGLATIAVANAPGSAVIRLRLARALLVGDDVTGAAEALRFVTATDPARDDAWLLHGEVARRQGQDDDARVSFTRARDAAERAGHGDIRARAEACLRGEPLADISEPVDPLLR